jgi:hypothetical protein
LAGGGAGFAIGVAGGAVGLATGLPTGVVFTAGGLVARRLGEALVWAGALLRVAGG